MKHRLAFFVLLLGLFVVVQPAAAQEAASTSVEAVAAEVEVVAETPVVETALTAEITAEVPAVESAPAAESVSSSPVAPRLGIWASLRERISLAVTRNPIAKAEKEMRFAEGRLAAAQAVLASVDATDEAKARAEAAMKRAEELMARASARVQSVDGADAAKQEGLLSNIAVRQLRASQILDRIEEKLPEEKKAQFAERRERIEARSEEVLKRIESGAMSEELKNRIEEVKVRVEARAEAAKEFRSEQKVLIERIQSGDESAKTELESLREERKVEVKDGRVEYREKKEEVRDAARAGEPGAKMELRVINKVEDVRRDVRDEVREGQDDRREEVKMKLETKVESGDESAAKKLEMLKVRDEKLDTRDQKLDVRDDKLDEKDRLREEAKKRETELKMKAEAERRMMKERESSGSAPSGAMPDDRKQIAPVRAIQGAKELERRAEERKIMMEKEMERASQ